MVHTLGFEPRTSTVKSGEHCIMLCMQYFMWTNSIVYLPSTITIKTKYLYNRRKIIQSQPRTNISFIYDSSMRIAVVIDVVNCEK